jgi:hypothetical protein
MAEMFNPQNPEILELNRQRKLADLLTSQGMQTPQAQTVAGGVYVPPNPMEYLSKLFSTYAGTKANEALDTKEQALANALLAQKAQATQGILGAALGGPQQVQQAGPTPEGGNIAPQTVMQRPDLAQALRLASQDKTGAGAAFMPTLLKNTLPEDPTAVQEFKYAMQNPEFAQYQTGLKRAGAPSMNVVMGKSIAEQVGPMMKEAQAVAQAAVKTEDSANRIIQSVDSNKMFSGTGANVRLGAAQVANTLGVGGNTLEQKIGNTRQAMQGLAELTLQGRQQMRGQGAITESESKLAERAISGDISFTPTEIKQLANAAKRSSDYTYNNYQTKLQNMAKNADTAGLVPYYEVQKMTQPNAMPNQSAIDAEIARRQGKR